MEDLCEEEINKKLDVAIKAQDHRTRISLIILITAIVICLFLINLLSANFGKELTTAWMKGCIWAFINDTFFAQTLKALLIYAISCCIKNPLNAKNEKSLGGCANKCSNAFAEIIFA